MKYARAVIERYRVRRDVQRQLRRVVRMWTLAMTTKDLTTVSIDNSGGITAVAGKLPRKKK